MRARLARGATAVGVLASLMVLPTAPAGALDADLTTAVVASATQTQTLVTAEADLSVSLTAPGRTSLSGPVAYTATVSNAGPDTATGVTLTDVLPEGLTFTSGDGCATVGQAVTCEVGALTEGDSTTVTLVATGDGEPGTRLNAVAVSAAEPDPTPADNRSATVSTQVTEIADVAVSVFQPLAGQSYSWHRTYVSATVHNAGPDTARGVVLTADMTHLEQASVSYNPACTLSGDSTLRTLTCAVGDLPVGGDFTAQVNGEAEQVLGLRTDTAARVTSTSVDPDLSDQTAIGTTRMQTRELAVGLTGPATVALGASVASRLTVRNAAGMMVPTATASGQLPTALVGGSVPSHPCTNDPVLVSGDLTCTLEQLSNNNQYEIDIVGTAPDSDTDLVTSASASFSRTDYVEPDSYTTSTITTEALPLTTKVRRQSDLGVSLTAPGPRPLGAPLSYRLTVDNAGPNEAKDVVADLSLPLTALEGLVLPTGCVVAGEVITCTRASLAVGDSWSWTVTGTAPPSPAELTAVASLAPWTDPDEASPDLDPSNDVSAVSTTAIERRADLSATVTGPTDGALGSALTSTLELRNDGPHAITDGVLVDVVTGAQGLTTDTEGCTVSGLVLTCTGIALAPGETFTAAVTALSPSSPGDVVHTATASSEGSTDLDPSDDVAVLTASVEARADVAATVSALAAIVRGQALDHVLTVVNHGPNAAADVTVAVPVPTGLTPSPDLPTGCDAAEGTVTCAVGTLDVDASVDVVLTSTTTQDGELSVTATAGTSTRDVDRDNDTGPAALTLVSAPVQPVAPLPVAPPAPAGGTTSNSGVSTDPAGSVTVGTGGLTGDASGRGGLTVTRFASSDHDDAPGATTGDYYTLAVNGSHAFDRLDLRLAGATSLFWWDGSAWRKPQGTTRDPATGDLLVTVDAASSPGLEQLDQLQLASGATPAVRLGGADRGATAVQASQAGYPVDGSAGAAVLARDDVFADALTGGPLAAAKSGPLLLIGKQALAPAVAAELLRLLPKGRTVYLLGGEQALSAEVLTAVQQLGYVPVRISGATRYETAVSIAQALGNPSVVFQATGLDFPDAMASGPAAIAQGAAVLLTAGPEQSSATRAYLAGRTVTRYAVGGQAASADDSAEALVRDDRFATSALVATRFFPAPSQVGVAIGQDFPDSLVAAPYLGKAGNPLLLTSRDASLPRSIDRYLTARSSGIGQVTVFGGTAAFGPQLLEAVQRALP